MGGCLQVVGHGLRDRQIRGCIDADGAAVCITIRVRRYRCRVCGAMMTVVPLGVAARRHFGAGTLGLAVSLFGHGCQARRIRERLGGLGAPEVHGWVTLRRWTAALVRGSLLARLGPLPLAEPRARAARAAMIIVTHAPTHLSSTGFARKAFEGAVRLARAA